MGIRHDNFTYQSNLMATLTLLLRPQGATIKELRENLGVARSTVYEYIDTLSLLGYPVGEPERRGREMVYRADADSIRKLTPLTGNTELTPDDKELLSFLENASGSSALKAILSPMLDKILMLAADGGVSYRKADGSSITAIVDIPPIMKKTSPKTAEITTALISAIRQNQRIDIDYYPASKGEQKKIENLFPIVCFTHDGGCYFYALKDSSKLLTLAIERIAELKVIVGNDNTPSYSSDYVAELLSDPFGITLTEQEPVLVKLYVDKGQAYYYKELDWPDSVKLEDSEDGGIYIILMTRGLWELERWIMKNSPVIKVIEPESIKADIKWILEESFKYYI